MVAVSGGGGLYAWQIEPDWIEVSTLHLQLPRLQPAFRGYRIIQLSDLHSDDSWMTAGRLAQIVRLANAQQPDLTVITGDFVTHYLKDTPRTLSVLRDLQARDGIFAILGNHDHWSGAERVRSLVQANGIHELNDDIYTIQRAGGAMLHLVGLDDLWPMPSTLTPLQQHLGRAQALASRLPDDGTAILLVHEPDFADVAATVGRFDLQLSGHSHGGQVRIPVYGAIRLPPFSRHYPVGLYQTGSLLHYTNRGLGMIRPQVRFNCRPEITVIELL